MEKQATRSESSGWHLQAPTRMSLIVLKRSQRQGPVAGVFHPIHPFMGGEGGESGGALGGESSAPVQGVPRLS